MYQIWKTDEEDTFADVLCFGPLAQFEQRLVDTHDSKFALSVTV